MTPTQALKTLQKLKKKRIQSIKVHYENHATKYLSSYVFLLHTILLILEPYGRMKEA